MPNRKEERLACFVPCNENRLPDRRMDGVLSNVPVVKPAAQLNPMQRIAASTRLKKPFKITGIKRILQYTLGVLLCLGVVHARQIRLSALQGGLMVNDSAVLRLAGPENTGKLLSADNREAAYEANLHFALLNDGPTDTTVYLRLATNSFIRLRLYGAGGKLVHQQQTGYEVPVQQQFGQDEEFVLPIRLLQGQAVQAVVYLKGFFGSEARPEAWLYTYTGYLHYLQQVKSVNDTQDFCVVFFVGATLMLLLFFLFMYAESRQALYGRYALYLLLQWAYGMLKLGPTTLLGYYILHYPFWQFVLVEPVVIAAVGCYAWFVNDLLDLKGQVPRLYRTVKAFAYIMWAYSLGVLMASVVWPQMHFRSATWTAMRLFLLLSNIPLLVYIMVKVKSAVKGYYVAGNTLFLFFSLVAGLHSGISFFATGYLGRFTTTTWYMMGILLECIFFAFALGIRIKQLQQNKQVSDARLIEQMQENERLITGANQQLEQKVAERTDTLRRQAEQLEAVRLQETRAAYEKQLSETRMQALRSRMNPHFIFNSLNSIKYFIVKNENDTAEFYLNKFSRLLRLILDYTTHETITLQQELEALNVYLEIESVRFDQSFHYYIEIDETLNIDSINIPPLLLQPFVENAIWHGLANSEKEEKECRIRISRTNGHILMQVYDNGVGRREAARIGANKPSRHSSHGLKITDERVVLFNNMNERQIQIEVRDEKGPANEPAGTTVNITLKNVEP